jgi:DNA-binding response OmpR family regulator
MKGIRILLVDRDPKTLGNMKFRLETYGFRVKVAASSDEALELIRDNIFDVALTGMSPSREENQDSFRKMRRALPNLRIIILPQIREEDAAMVASVAAAAS